jgi:diguanylate cyclase (GGDEF)-like protein/PAS domain S-box-containing protein
MPPLATIDSPPAAAPPPQGLGPRDILDALLDPHLLLSPHRARNGKITDFTITAANLTAAEYYDLDREDMIGSRLLRLLPDDNASVLLAMARDAYDSGEPLVVNNFAFALEIYGRERRFDIRAVRLDDHLMWTWRDVTERHLAAKRLAASEERYRLLAENSSDVVARLRHGTIVWISPSVTSTFGWTPDECTGRKVEDFVEPADRELCAENIARLDAGHTVLGRHRIVSKNGTRHWIETHASPYLDADGRPDGFVATSRIVDTQVAAEQELEHRVRTDELTQLLSRKEVLHRIEVLNGQHRRTGEELAVLFCDIDRFKDINDTHGHAAGDEVLRVMADRLRQTLRGSDDLAARLGGDELLIVLHGVQDLGNALALAEKLRAAGAAPIPTPAGPIHATLSIGVTLAQPGENSDSIVARADAAMYRAKQSGRNHAFPFDGGEEPSKPNLLTLTGATS